MAKNFDWLRERLTEIACLDDALANQRLETTGSYSCFDEPGSVRIAREILTELELTPAQAGAAGEPIAWREEIAKLIELATDINCSPHMIGARVVNGIDRYRSFLAAPPEPHAALRGLQLVQEEVSRAALAAENLARHQEQCDIDGVMIKVSRQAADETIAALETINTIVRAALSPSAPAEGGLVTAEDVRWGVNVLLETIAKKFEENDTLDIWQSDAAALVRSFKHAPAGHSGQRTCVRPLIWEPIERDRGDGTREVVGWEADSGFGPFYEIEQYFSSDSLDFKISYDMTRLGDFDDPDHARKCGQEHYERLILAVLSSSDPSPGGRESSLPALRQAIIDHTHGDLFWIGEILLNELTKETGFDGARHD